MRKLTCIVVDDEPLAVKMLESFIQRTDSLQLQASFTDSLKAMQVIQEQPADLLFLDIQMPDLDGMSLANLAPRQTRIIFTTAFKEFAFDSYEVNALDYLLKPIRYNKFSLAVEKAREWFERTEAAAAPSPAPAPAAAAARPSTAAPEVPTRLFLRIDGQLRPVELSRVLYVSGMKDYVMFYLQDEKRPLVTHLTLKAVEEMLPVAGFMRVHRSYIVALDKIRSIDRNNCIYIGTEVIRVSESYTEAFNAYVRTLTPSS